MNITTTSGAQAPVPSHKPSVPTRGPGDAGHDESTDVPFLSLLQAMADPGAHAEPPEPDQPVVADAAMAEALHDVQSPPSSIDETRKPGRADGTSGPAGSLAGGRSAWRAGPTDATAADDVTDRLAGDAPGVPRASDGAVRGHLAGHDPLGAAQDEDDFMHQMARRNTEAIESTQAQADKARAAREPDMAMQRVPVPSQASVSLVSMFEAGLAGWRAGPGARGVERGQDRHAAAPGAASAASGFLAWTDSAPVNASQQSANPVYAPTAATPVPAAALAQRMHYWVAGGVHSAELQLDAFGGGSVDVRIAVKGEEAMVAFRSDQPQARQLLLEAMPQLKELLAGEGLVLSGGFVGDSARQAPDGQDSSRQQPARVVEAGSAQEGGRPASVPRAAGPARGGAIDLFV